MLSKLLILLPCWLLVSALIACNHLTQGLVIMPRGSRVLTDFCQCRWDRVSVQRLLTKLFTAPTLLTPAPSTSTKGLNPLARALASMPDPDKEEKGVHPQHVCIQLDQECKSILGEHCSHAWNKPFGKPFASFLGGNL